MECIEKIPVYIRIANGKTVCICHAGAKKCGRTCQRDKVSRDRFDEWQKAMNRNKYGQ